MSLIDDHRAALAASSLPVAPVAPSLYCRFCGSTPAVDTKFRGHVGMVIMMRMLSQTGPFCRDCGIAAFRRMTANTLVAGWWGYGSFVITPFVLVMNLVRRAKVAKLDPPQFAAAGRAPAAVGKPLIARWQIVGLLVPFAVVAIIVGVATSGSSSSSSDPTSPSFTDKVGECVQPETAAPDSIVDIVNCSQPHQGRVSKIVSNEADCPAETMFTVTNGDPESQHILCVAENFN